ncbi:heat-inducible transcriptional repressor HrcA [Fibrobacterota bacterium]
MSRKKKQPKLNERQEKVLTAVIQNFITSALPVSSRVIAGQSYIRTSSATVRNTMAQLESLGLIEHQHTSSGRQPTDLGYRVYLNSLIHIQKLRKKEKNIISKQLAKVGQEDEILRLTSVILGKITNLLGIAATTIIEEGIFERLNLIQVAEKKIMLIIAISSGLARSLMVELEMDISSSQLEAIESFINEKIAGRPVSFLNTCYFREIDKYVEGKFSSPIRIFTSSILKLLHSYNFYNVQTSGTKNIVNQPEFEKIEDVEGIIELLDDKRTLVHFLQGRTKHKGVYVTVGREHKLGIFKTHSVITSTFNLGGARGTVGVIGPMRMDYSKLISVVDYTAKILSGNSEKGW